MTRRTFIFGAAALAARPSRSQAAAETPAGVRHSFLALGSNTYILSEAGEKVWEWPHGTRDGWVLPNGNVLLVETKVAGKHGGKVVETTRSGDVLFEYVGTQQEVNTVQALDNGRILLTEGGSNPRILELERSGKIAFELPIDCQKKDGHTQSRMTRKLLNGNYLVPLMTEREVREITAKGEVVWRAKTPHWPFTAIRLANGNTVVNGTQANACFEFDVKGSMVWQLTNDDVTGEPFDGMCGAQRLPNGNTVVTSYRHGGPETKMTEVTRDKQVVWTYRDEAPQGIHHFHILTTNGEATPRPALR